MKRFQRTFSILTAVVLFSGSMATRAFGSAKDLPAEWLTDWTKATELAKSSGKPLLAVFSAEWCGPCQQMIKTVYPKPEVKEALKNWVAVYIDEAADPKRMEQFQVESFPTFILFSSDGKEEDRFIGGRPAKSFLDRLANYKVFAKRLPELRSEVEKNPTNAAAWKELGDIYIKKDELETAITAYETAAKNDPSDKTEVADDVEFYHAMPKAKEDLPKSIETYDAFERKYPKSPLVPQAHLYRAWLRANMGKEAEAKVILADGIKRFPDSENIEDMKQMLAMIEENSSKQ